MALSLVILYHFCSILPILQHRKNTNLSIKKKGHTLFENPLCNSLSLYPRVLKYTILFFVAFRKGNVSPWDWCDRILYQIIRSKSEYSKKISSLHTALRLILLFNLSEGVVVILKFSSP